jgi:membrane-bound lytic murein transglycosylase D
MRTMFQHFTLSLIFSVFITSTSAFAQEASNPSFSAFPCPRTLTLCGERMPLENQDVYEMLDREFTVMVWDHARIFMLLKRAARYFPYMEKALRDAGMPDDLKYLAVAESSLIPYARSNSNAVGHWQFIPETGQRKGLRKDTSTDERMALERSTQAAILYLTQLKEMFGSWTLAMAGYNCGENRLQKEIGEQKVSDYYRLNLPTETERYIFRIAAIKIIMENPRRYGYILPEDQLYKPLKFDTVTVNISSSIHITDLAQAIGTDFKVIKELNPELLGYYLPTGLYSIKVPAGSGTSALAVLAQLDHGAPAAARPNNNSSVPANNSNNSSQGLYVVQPGDTLTRISVVTGVPVERLKALNGIPDSHIEVGQKLKLAP